MCKTCRIHYASHTTTGNRKGVSNATSGCLCSGARGDATSKQDQQGYYQVSDLDIMEQLSSKSPPADREICKPCAEGIDCTKDGTRLKDLSAKSGFWRPTGNSEVSLSCAKAYSGESLYRQSLAEKRCCPVVGNTSLCKDLRFGHETDHQCVYGYSGPLCRGCDAAAFHVVIGDGCLECPGGSHFGLAFASTVLATTCMYVFHLFWLLKCTTGLEEGDEVAVNHKNFAQLGQIKILINFARTYSTNIRVLSWFWFFVSFRTRTFDRQLTQHTHTHSRVVVVLVFRLLSYPHI